MQVKSCTIDGKKVKSLNDVYDELSRQLNLPAHFGRNLDALYDVLSTDLAGPVKIIWHNPKASKAALGDQYEKIKAVLKDVATERKDIKLLFKS
jgi:ribonuclease inhibitor